MPIFGESAERSDDSRQERIEQLINNPEQIFDCEIPTAEKDYNKLIESLENIGEKHINLNNVEITTTELGNSRFPEITITWKQSDRGIVLTPITEGHGYESGLLGYTGRYGKITTDSNGNKRLDKKDTISFEELYRTTDDNIKLIIKPTSVYWAAAKDQYSAFYGENYRTMYMGLGLLFCGEEWMYIGYHEAGHMPHNPNENKAWSIGNRKHASFYKGENNLQRRQNVIEQKGHGLFGILERPKWFNNKKRIIQIERYGLVSHYLHRDASIPSSWRTHINDIMSGFRTVLDNAVYYYDEFNNKLEK